MRQAIFRSNEAFFDGFIVIRNLPVVLLSPFIGLFGTDSIQAITTRFHTVRTGFSAHVLLMNYIFSGESICFNSQFWLLLNHMMPSLKLS